MLSRSDWPSDYQEQFWQIYPRRIAKKAALRMLERIQKSREVPFEVLLSAVHNYARAMAGRDMKYVAHPSTWLHQGRWDDDPDALLDVKVAPAMPLDSGRVLIRRGSPQARAWEAHRGKAIPWGREGVWQVESEWPPK